MSMATEHRSLKERQRDEREQLILREGEALIAEKGYSETSMDDIAARVGVSKGTLYLHFASKEDLVLAIVEANLHVFADSVKAILTSDRAPREKLEDLIRLVYTGSSEHRIAMMESLLRIPELRIRLMEQKKEVMEDFGRGFAQRLNTVIDAGKANGDFDPDIPTPVLQTIFTGLMHPANFRGSLLVAENPIPVDDLISYVSQFYFRGAAAQHARQEGE